MTKNKVFVGDIIDNKEVKPTDVDLTFTESVNADISLYELFIRACSVEKSKSGSTLSDMLHEDEETQKFLLSDYVHAVLKRVCFNSDTRLKTNDAGFVCVINEEYAPVVLENGRLHVEQVTKPFVIKSVKLFPNVSNILSDIALEKSKRIPQLPKSVFRVIDECFKYPIDTDWILPVITRERLCNVLSNIHYRKLPVNLDIHMKVYKDVSMQIKSTIIKNKMVKETLPTNSQIGIEQYIISKYSEFEGFTDEQIEEQYKAFGM